MRYSKCTTDPTVSVRPALARPRNVPSPGTDRKVSNYVNLTLAALTGCESKDIQAGHVTISVPKDWMRVNNIHPWAIQFPKFDEEINEWVSFTGKRVGEDFANVYYSVPPSGFSLWSITGSESVPPIQFVIENVQVLSLIHI